MPGARRPAPRRIPPTRPIITVVGISQLIDTQPLSFHCTSWVGTVYTTPDLRTPVRTAGRTVEFPSCRSVKSAKDFVEEARMREKRTALECTVLALCLIAAASAAQPGFPSGDSQEPSLYDQATGKVRFAIFGPWQAYAQGDDPIFGKVFIRSRHVLDLSKAATSGEGNVNAKDFEKQVIDFQYPFDPKIDQYKSSGDEKKLDECIHNIIDKPFLRATVVKGSSEGVSLRQSSGGKYMLWPGAPEAFGNSYDVAGLVVKDRNEYLYAMNVNDTSIIVFLTPSTAERHYATGRVEVLSASFMEWARAHLLAIAGAFVGLIAIFLIALIARRISTSRRQSLTLGAGLPKEAQPAVGQPSSSAVPSLSSSQSYNSVRSPRSILAQKVTTTDDTLQLYQSCDLSSNVIAQVSEGAEIQLGAGTVHQGREWMEGTLEDGRVGYVLGPSVRGHTKPSSVVRQAD